MRHTLTLTPPLLDYIQQIGLREHPILTRCRHETATLGDNAIMQISPEQGAFMQMLIRLTHARKTLEIGTFTGYSALATALALPEDGQLFALDLSEDYLTQARTYWSAADMGHKIISCPGPAVQTLDTLIADGQSSTFDFAFIDADKPNYDNYYERALTLLHSGGLIAIDNVLWNGAVADPSKTDDATTAIRTLNAKIHSDERVTIVLVPISDGLFLCQKR